MIRGRSIELVLASLVTLAFDESMTAGDNKVAVIQPQSVSMKLDTIGLRIQLGVDDGEPSRWDGKVRLSAGEILEIAGWRTRPDDRIEARSGWKASSYQLNKPPQGQPRMSPTGVVLTIDAPRGARLEVETSQGTFQVPLDEAKPGQRLQFLGGRVLVDSVAPAVQITSGETENDFPAAATAPDGTIWVAYVTHTHRGRAALDPIEMAPREFKSLIPEGGGDQVMLTHFDGKQWSSPIPVSEPGQDVWRPAIAIGRDVVGGAPTPSTPALTWFTSSGPKMRKGIGSFLRPPSIL